MTTVKTGSSIKVKKAVKIKTGGVKAKAPVLVKKIAPKEVSSLSEPTIPTQNFEVPNQEEPEILSTQDVASFDIPPEPVELETPSEPLLKDLKPKKRKPRILEDGAEDLVGALSSWQLTHEQSLFLAELVRTRSATAFEKLHADMKFDGGWVVKYVEDRFRYGASSCECGHPVRYEFWCEDTKGRMRRVGSQCVLNHSDFSEEDVEMIQAGFRLISREISNTTAIMKQYTSYEVWNNSHTFHGEKIWDWLNRRHKLIGSYYNQALNYQKLKLPVPDELLRKAYKDLIPTYIGQLEKIESSSNEARIQLRALRNMTSPRHFRSVTEIRSLVLIETQVFN